MSDQRAGYSRVSFCPGAAVLRDRTILEINSVRDLGERVTPLLKRARCSRAFFARPALAPTLQAVGPREASKVEGRESVALRFHALARAPVIGTQKNEVASSLSEGGGGAWPRRRACTMALGCTPLRRSMGMPSAQPGVMDSRASAVSTP